MSSSKLTCIAVDDEPHAIKILSLYIQKIPQLELLASTNSPWEAIQLAQNLQPDILFLDIQMDELTGLQVLDILGHSFKVILTTAYAEYALQGFDYQVSDYLLKPFSFDRFQKAVQKIEQELSQADVPPTSSTMTHILIKGDAKNKFHRLALVDILYVEGLKNYVQFVGTKEKVITLQNLKHLEQLLPNNQFFRIHKSYIINLAHINKIDGNMAYIDDKAIPIGNSYRKSFFERIQKEKLD
jgi:DNA-binding LytR/AlgR family response regulator